jgi:hypothetical protein
MAQTCERVKTVRRPLASKEAAACFELEQTTAIGGTTWTSNSSNS